MNEGAAHGGVRFTMSRTFKLALAISVGAHAVAFVVTALLPSSRRDAVVPLEVPVVQLVSITEDPAPPVEQPAAIPEKVIPPAPVVTPKPEPVPPPEKREPVPLVLATPKPAPVEIKPAPAATVPTVAPVRPPELPASPLRATTNTATSAAPEVVRVRGTPSYRTRIEPVYPVTARKRRQEGTVLLRVQLDAAGQVESARVEKSSGFVLLDEAARQAVRAWEFESAKLDAHPVPSEVEVPVRFLLSQ